MTEKLSSNEIEQRLQGLEGWEVNSDGKLQRNFQFKNFVEAFGFMTKAALYSETANHHPEWFNVYDRVNVELTTHDAGGISIKDFELAEKMNSLLL